MITITINTDNAAFQDNESFEVIRILQRLVDSIRDGGYIQPSYTLRDLNGNTVGTLETE